MKRDEQDELLKELIAGEELSGFRRASLDRALAAIQRGKRRRRALQTGILAVIPVLLAVMLVLNRPGRPAVVPESMPRISTAATETRSSDVKLMTDEELLALFPGRSVALIGPPGNQQLVFLDGNRDGEPGDRL